MIYPVSPPHYLISFSPSYHFYVFIPHYAIFSPHFHQLFLLTSIVSHTLCLLLYKIFLHFGGSSLPSCLSTSKHLLMHHEAHTILGMDASRLSLVQTRCRWGLWALFSALNTVISMNILVFLSWLFYFLIFFISQHFSEVYLSVTQMKALMGKGKQLLHLYTSVVAGSQLSLPIEKLGGEIRREAHR